MQAEKSHRRGAERGRAYGNLQSMRKFDGRGSGVLPGLRRGAGGAECAAGTGGTGARVCGAAAPAVQKTNSLAIAGFVCSIMGFFCCGIPALVGLILSIVGYSQIKSRNEGGKGLAVAGIIIGAVLPVLMIVFYVLYFTFFAMIA